MFGMNFLPTRLTRLSVAVPVVAALLVAILAVAPAGAQGTAKAKAASASPPLVGTWSGTASVPLGDSTIVVPVTYTFLQSGGAITGTALVPGQGSGPIANVVREGPRVRFRVTAPEGKILEHDGTMRADGAIEGLVNLDNLPVAKFRISPKRQP